MAETDISNFVLIIDNILGSDNIVRKSSEQALNDFKLAKPNEFVIIYLKLLKGNKIIS
jgi:hypothetical protein